MWLVLAGVVLLLAALIVAIALDVEVSTQTSVAILAACGLIALALILNSSRRTAGRGRGTDQQPDSSGDIRPDSGHLSNWVFLADACVERQEFAAAEKLYRRAADAGHVGAMAHLAEVLYELGRDEEAEHYRRLSRGTDP